MTRPKTWDIIREIDDTRKILDKLIKRYKDLEHKLKGLPARNYVRNIRKYLELLKNRYLWRFREDMVKIHKKSLKAMKEHAKMIKKLKEV